MPGLPFDGIARISSIPQDAPLRLLDGATGTNPVSASEPVALPANALPPLAQIRQTILTRWVEAFNARDLDRMLACLSIGVDFRPLRLAGLRECYHGHRGVREWFAELSGLGYAHRIILSEVRHVGDGQVFAIGALRMAAGEPDMGPFCALHRVKGRLIVAVQHHLTDAELSERGAEVDRDPT